MFPTFHSVRFSRLVAGVVIASAFAISALHAQSQNILFIGNSFTFGQGGAQTSTTPAGVGSIVQSLAASAGLTANVQTVAAGGVSLSTHAIPGSLAQTAIANGAPGTGAPWDVIVLQEFSTNPTASAGNLPQFATALTDLASSVETYNPNAKIVLYETWARDAGHSIYPNTFTDQEHMQCEVHDGYLFGQNHIQTNVAGFSGVNDVEIAFAGDAWLANDLNLMGPGINLYDSDLHHGNDAGYYLSALEIFETIYDQSAVGLTNASLSVQDAQYLQNLSVAVHGQKITSTTVLAPEPSSALLSLIAGVGFILRRRRA